MSPKTTPDKAAHRQPQIRSSNPDTKLNWIAGILGELETNTLQSLALAEAHWTLSLTEELPQGLINAIHDKTQQKTLGIAYTPDAVRRSITWRVLDRVSNKTPVQDLSVCDPCCGTGGFVLSALEWFQERNVPIDEALNQNIYFCDIDRKSLALALLRISMLLESANIELEGVKPQCSIQDFFESEEKYHALIANPPYVKLQNLDPETRAALRRKYSDYFFGSIGLAPLFLKHMFESLLPDGTLGVITQNNFFTSAAGTPLRAALQDHLIQIDTFGSESIFPGLTTYTCLFFLDNRPTEYFDFRRLRSTRDLHISGSKVSTKSLSPQKWRLGTHEELQMLELMETKGTPLGKACRIWVGIATQLDKAFTVQLVNGEWIGSGLDQTPCLVESAIVRPLIRVSDFSCETDLAENSRGVIFPYRIIDGIPTPISEQELSSSFKGAFQQLTSWKTELLKRNGGRLSATDWYHWGRRQSMIAESQKLLTKTFSRGPNFLLDCSDSLFSNGYALKPRSDQFGLPFVQAVLNSKSFSRYACLTSFEIKGDYQCFQKNFIEHFCLPDISRLEQEELLSNGNVEDYLSQYYEPNLSWSP